MGSFQSQIMARDLTIKDQARTIAALEAKVASLQRQRDELHATTARYWERIIGWQAASKDWAQLAVRALNCVENSKYHSAAQAQAYKARDAAAPNAVRRLRRPESQARRTPMSGRLTGNWRWKLTLFGKMRLQVQEVFDAVDLYGNPDTIIRWREPVATDMGMIGAVFITPEQYAEGKRL